MSESSSCCILVGRAQEKRLPRNMSVHGEFSKPLPSQLIPDSFIAKAGFTLLAEGTGGGEIPKVPSHMWP